MAEHWQVKAERLARREGITFREACQRLQARAVRVRAARRSAAARRKAEDERAAALREMRPDLYG